MDMGDFFRSIFGLRRKDWTEPFNFNEDSESERIPNNRDSDDYFRSRADDDDSDINEFSFFGNDQGSLDDMFRHFHGDMFRQMESIHRQMDEIMKGFGAITSDHHNPFENPRIKDKPGSEKKGDQEDGFTWSFSLPPFQGKQPKNPRDSLLKDDEEGFKWSFSRPPLQEKQPKNPRDFMLKDDEEKSKSESVPSTPSQPKGSDDFHFKWSFQFPPWNRPHHEKKGLEDTDLDDKVSQREVLDLIKESDSPRSKDPTPNHPTFFSSGSSFSMTTIQGPDGRVEHKKVVRDSSGREQTTVTRSIGEQSHSVTTTLDEQGHKEHHEDFKNMDENDIKKFEEKWHTASPTRPIAPNAPFNPSLRIHSDDGSLFSRLFGRSW